jgi:hypothetical protein
MAGAAFDPFEVVRYHPDKHRGNPLEELAAAKLIEINRAYELLSDDDKRAAYERRGQPSRPAPTSGSGTVPAAPQPIMKLLNSVGVIVSLILFLRFGLGLARSILMGLLSVMRMGPVFAIAVVLAIMFGGSYLMRGRRK